MFVSTGDSRVVAGGPIGQSVRPGLTIKSLVHFLAIWWPRRRTPILSHSSGSATLRRTSPNKRAG